MIENRPVRLKQRRLFSYAVIALAAALLGTFAVLNWNNGNSRLARMKERLRANGEKLLLDEFVSRGVRTTNSMPALAKFKDIRSRFGGSIGLMVPVAPGRARVAWKSDRLYEGDSAVRGYWAELDADVEKEHATLAEFRRFVQGDLPRDTGWDYRDQRAMTPNYLIEKRRAAQFLSVAVLSDLHRDRLPEALENLHALIALAKIHDQDGMLVIQMIRVAIAGLGVSATWEALQAQGWNDAQLAGLQTQWEALRLLEQVLFALEVERAMALELFEQARTNAAGFQSFSANGTTSAKDRFYGSVWKTLFSQADGQAYLEEMQPCIEAARLGIRQRNWRAMERHLAPTDPQQNALSSLRETIDDWRFPITDTMMPNVRKALQTVMKQETMRQMAIAALALNRYRLKQGEFPGALHQLVPEFLPEVPVDCMDGQPLRYHRDADGTWRLYSVGLNGRDEGGDASSTTNSLQLWQGLDLVWPRAAQEGPH